MIKYKSTEVSNFLEHSNAIEGVYSHAALKDARRAWAFGVRNFEKKWGVDLILGIHEELMKTIDPCIAGKLRDQSVRIGYEIKKFICYKLLYEEIEVLCDSYDITKKHTAKKIEQWHVKFEGIHPFLDGNGRTGRIIMNLQRMFSDLPLLTIHEGYEQFEYYKLFNKYIINPYEKDGL